VVAADLNGDGAKDLMTADSDDNTASILFGNVGTTTTITTTGSNIPFDISTQSDASGVLSALDSGLTYLNQQRSSIGAYEARLESALGVNQVTAQNIAQAKSQVTDSDIVSETSELVKGHILQQSGLNVLAQPNVQNQLILKLLHF
jgi:flagellin